MKRRIRTSIWYAIPLLLSVAILAIGLQWRRSFRVLDQRSYAWMRFDPTPRNTSPAPADYRAGIVYPPGGPSYRGTFREWRCDTFNGRIVFRFGDRSQNYPKPEVPEHLKPDLGWKRGQLPIGDVITYNIPRGNVYISRTEFNWNGLATWPYFINGDAAQWVMVPHWMLLCLTALPLAVWLTVFVARARIPAGHCRFCRYDRTGITGPCPECGKPA